MAYVGLRYAVAAQIDTEVSGQPVTYKPGKVLGKLRNCNISYERSDAEMYADDALCESDNSIVGGTTSFELAGMTDEIRAYLFGQKTSGADGEYVETSQPAPWCGFGYIRGVSNAGVTSFEAYWVYKVQHATGDETANTKEKSTSFAGVPVTGKMAGVVQSASLDIEWRVHKTFTDYAGAVSWLKGKAGITA